MRTLRTTNQFDVGDILEGLLDLEIRKYWTHYYRQKPETGFWCSKYLFSPGECLWFISRDAPGSPKVVPHPTPPLRELAPFCRFEPTASGPKSSVSEFSVTLWKWVGNIGFPGTPVLNQTGNCFVCIRHAQSIRRCFSGRSTCCPPGSFWVTFSEWTGD